MTGDAWCDKTLGDVILLQRGFDLTEKSNDPGPYPVISSGGTSYTTATPKVDGPGVVTGRKGVLGKVYFSEGPYWPHDTTLWVKDFRGNDPRYVYYLLHTLPLAHLDAGASNPTLNRNHAHLLRVRVPDVGTQRKIAAALAAFDDFIEINRRRIESLGETARLLYREWFVHFRFPGHGEVEFVNSNLGTIPAGWRTTTLGAVANVNERSLRAGDPVGEILYLDISSVGPRAIEAPEAMEFSSAPGRARRLVAAGDTVWSTVRPNRRSHALLVDPPPNLVCSTGFAVLTPRAVPSSYLFELTSTDEFTAHLTGLATGSAYPAVRPADFECYPLALPPAELLDQYDTVVGPMHRLQHTLSEQNRVLSAARDLLLPRLIAGELDVSDLDLDLEPVA